MILFILYVYVNNLVFDFNYYPKQSIDFHDNTASDWMWFYKTFLMHKHIPLWSWNDIIVVFFTVLWFQLYYQGNGLRSIYQQRIYMRTLDPHCLWSIKNKLKHLIRHYVNVYRSNGIQIRLSNYPPCGVPCSHLHH